MTCYNFTGIELQPPRILNNLRKSQLLSCNWIKYFTTLIYLAFLFGFYNLRIVTSERKINIYFRKNRNT